MICKTLVFCNNGKQESNIDKTEKKYIASENLVLAAATGEAMVRILLLNSMNFFWSKKIAIKQAGHISDCIVWFVLDGTVHFSEFVFHI